MPEYLDPFRKPDALHQPQSERGFPRDSIRLSRWIVGQIFQLFSPGQPPILLERPPGVQEDQATSRPDGMLGDKRQELARFLSSPPRPCPVPNKHRGHQNPACSVLSDDLSLKE